jgi:hypothetical protein
MLQALMGDEMMIRKRGLITLLFLTACLSLVFAFLRFVMLGESLTETLVAAAGYFAVLVTGWIAIWITILFTLKISFWRNTYVRPSGRHAEYIQRWKNKDSRPGP